MFDDVGGALQPAGDACGGAAGWSEDEVEAAVAAGGCRPPTNDDPPF